jgi:hypothetical protein
MWHKTIVKNSADRHAIYTPAYSSFVDDNALLLFNISKASATKTSDDFGYEYGIYLMNY